MLTGLTREPHAACRLALPGLSSRSVAGRGRPGGGERVASGVEVSVHGTHRRGQGCLSWAVLRALQPLMTLPGVFVRVNL